jgi:HK97 family phage portal protein
MGLLDFFRSSKEKTSHSPRAQVEVMEAVDLTNERLVAFLRGEDSADALTISPRSGMRVTTAYRCIDLIRGAVANMPLDIKRKKNGKRLDVLDHPVAKVLTVRPNNWQTPSEFKSFLTMSLLIHGNGYAMKVKSRGNLIQLLPMAADRVTVRQRDDLSLVYTYTRKNGSTVDLEQDAVFHLRGMSFDGITGLSPMSYLRERLKLAVGAQTFAQKLFENGGVVSAVIQHPKSLDDTEVERFKESLEDFKGAKNSHRIMLLEDGMEYHRVAMTSVDAKLLELMEMTQTDVAMHYGVPPHMIGLTTKTTSWGSGIEQMGIGFVTYTLETYLTTWEESIRRDLLGVDDPSLYARLNRAGLVRGDIKTRYAAYAVGRNWGWLSANDVRALEDMDDIEDGDTYLQPANMTAVDLANSLATLGHNGGPPLEDDPTSDAGQ